MKPISIHPGSLALGAAFALTLALTLGAQGPILKPGPELRRPAAFAPHPESMWNYTTAEEADASMSEGAISVPAGTDRDIFQVPNDRWLVLTGGLSKAIRGSGTAYVDLVEVGASGSITPKVAAANMALYGQWTPISIIWNFGPSGILFAPGSTVRIRNQSPSGSATVTLTLAGYFVDAQ